MAVDVRRKVPSVDALLRSGPARRAASTLGRPLLKRMLEDVLAEVRSAAAGGENPPPDEVLLARALGRASRAAQGMVPVINATGVILHTNLGRAPLPERAARAVARAARSYTDIEVDRRTGRRGGRGGHAETLLTALTGAEGAMVVNNCAAALLLAMATLAKGKPVIVSRGELIEIGGEFRIPDILAASGARLAEVGTTNRTRIADYRAAVTDKTGMILKVHPSNYRVIGFTATPPAADLAALARTHDIPFLYDIGSGLLHHGHGHPADEPSVSDALEQGADLVTFSADKLLGGPQAGIIIGRAALLERLRRHPIARAVRIGRMQMAALEQVLSIIATGKEGEIPVFRMLRESPEIVRSRAQLLSETIGGELEGARVVRCESAVGGGSMPGTVLPSWGVRIRVPDGPSFAARLRTGTPSAFSRVEDGFVLLDCRTVTDAQIRHLARAVHYALEGDEEHDHDVHGGEDHRGGGGDPGDDPDRGDARA
ncbi:MAG: selenocysteine synthase [Actinomycetia bacterium]|jgi:L-seryl-tRNA(Ser) seleniumtransferase|nr:selenocysteine synthase [Actinomycetes bacterium]